MALKSTSSPIAISASMPLTVPVDAEASATKTIDLQLNPLDNEVFVVTAVKVDFLDLPQIDGSVSRTGDSFLQCSILKNEPPSGTVQTIANSNCIASSKMNLFIQVDTTSFAPVIAVRQYSIWENSAMDTPPATQDYLDIIATDNFVIQFSCGEGLASQTANAAVRVYGYRARADAATYAALVQSEVLSLN